VERVSAFQEAPAEITGSASWTKEKGPWVLKAQVTVRPGATLKVGPGVSVVCAPDSLLSVSGKLLVEGAPREPVAFRPSEAQKPWGGIHLLRTGTGQLSAEHLLSWCRFEGGRGQEPPKDSADLPASFVRVEGSKLRVENTVFRGIEGSALGSEGSVLVLRGLRISDGRSALVARGGSLSMEATEIRRLHRQGVDLVGVKGKISSTALRGVLRQGISVDGESLELEDVLIQESGVALTISGGAQVRASRLTLVSSELGISGARAGFLDLSSGVLWPNRQPFDGSPGFEMKLSDCTIGPSGGDWQAPDLKGLRLEKPAFVAPEKQDFKLR
jgi:hypothetical protein